MNSISKNKKLLNLRLVIIKKYIKYFLQKVTLQVGLKKFLWSQKLKMLFRGAILLMILMFYENKFQKPNQEEFRKEKVVIGQDNKLYVKWKGYDNWFNIWIDKKDIFI